MSPSQAAAVAETGHHPARPAPAWPPPVRLQPDSSSQRMGAARRPTSHRRRSLPSQDSPLPRCNVSAPLTTVAAKAHGSLSRHARPPRRASGGARARPPGHCRGRALRQRGHRGAATVEHGAGSCGSRVRGHRRGPGRRGSARDRPQQGRGQGGAQSPNLGARRASSRCCRRRRASVSGPSGYVRARPPGRWQVRAAGACSSECDSESCASASAILNLCVRKTTGGSQVGNRG